jgi:cell division protein FtsW
LSVAVPGTFRQRSMARKLKSDKLLFTATLLLVCTSIVMVYSASAVIAREKWQQPYLLLFKQAAWVLIGLSLVPIVMRIDYRSYRQPLVIWTALGLAAVALVAVLFATPVNGASRWLHVGPLGVQPSELAKLAIILFTAALLERRMDRIDELSHALLPIGLTTGAIVGLILVEPDLGTAVSVLVISSAMVFAAGISYRYVLGLVLVAVPALYVVVMASAYRVQRVMAFLDPWSDPQGSGYQMIQSMIAVGTGGFFGRGLMGGVQKLFYLPEPHNDFIYAVIAEELGLVGATTVLACFCVITWRGLRTAMRAPDRFGTFLAVGLTVMIAFQAFLNISVVTGIAPTKGIPLPFVSAGGSSLLINLIGMAILLNVSQHASSSNGGSYAASHGGSHVVKMAMAKTDA